MTAPSLFGFAPSCWWCQSPAHLPGWRGCPVVFVTPDELTPERRRLREVLS